MTDQERLKSLIEESGKTITEICKNTGIVRQTLYNKMNGRGDFTATEIQALVDELHLTARQRNEVFFARKVG